MIRRQIRERKEYLFKKALEQRNGKREEKKQILKGSLTKAAPILGLDDVKSLATDLTFDAGLQLQQSTRDDEYASAGIKDPRILITTSRDPSSRLQTFAKELKLVFPNSQRINRGNYVLSEIVKVCLSNEITDLIIVHEHRGMPNGLIISHFPHGPTVHFTLQNVVLRHDIKEGGKHISEAYPHLIFAGFSTELGDRIKSVLKYLFPVPKEDAHRVITFSNKNDFISFRHHSFDNSSGNVSLEEYGPRFEMKPYQIKLGLADFEQADTEWILRPYTNTARKKTYI